MKKTVATIRLGLITVMLTALSGCASLMMSAASNEVTLGDARYETVDTDFIVAFGKVAQGSEHSDALVFVGLKNSYLVISGQDKILNILNNFSGNELTVNKNAPINFVIKEKKGQPATLQGMLVFESAIASDIITAEQINKLIRLGFEPYGSESYQQKFAIEVAVYPSARNLEEITTKFHHTRQITLQRYHPPGPTIPNPAKILWPFAIAFDVVTFPVQAIIIPIAAQGVVI